ncbi:PREDICTED: uncharacterized protein LOC106101521 [Papilio polytes]|uniref:uncharacterized protein LOC106101521 n=1 Tax=Papilio polytes TaxID=76194 RepID=UPI0006761462|nr:PREDICTED: uncharacterized protein LOC106101521 [Papilio polytes]
MSILLELWALLKLVATVFVLPFYGLMAIVILAFSYKDYVEQFFFLAVFIIMVADVIFDILLMLASYKKSLCMFKIYYVYGIIYAISVPTVFISWLLYSIHVHDMDWRRPQAKKEILVASIIIAGVLTVHACALFLIKKEINKIRMGCQCKFIKQTSASRNSLLPSKKEQEI